MSNSGPNATVNEIHVSGQHPAQAQARLAYVVALIDRRREATVGHADTVHFGAPFVVHIEHWSALLAGLGSLQELEHIAVYGAHCGVIMRVYATDPVEVPTTSADRSKVLHDAFIRGQALQVIPPYADKLMRPGEGLKAPTNAGETVVYSETLSAEVWAALVLGDAEGLVRVFDALRKHVDDAGSLTECRLLSDALRRAADVLVPGSGGMIPSIRCPLCFGGPMFRPEEIEGHLSATHAALITGVRS